MYQIDFLPEEYRYRRAAHRQQVHRLLALAASAVLLAMASVFFYWHQKNLEEQLEMLRPTHSALSAQQKQLTTLQNHLQSVRAMAELICYLRHPWPRTRILAEVLSPLPKTVTLEQLSIDRQTPEPSPPQRPLSRSEQEAEKARLAAMPPPSRDMSRLRQEYDPMQTVVRLQGVTVDIAALHQYLAALEKADLFTKVSLVTLEKTGDQEALRFQIKLVVRPGYGQAGGPMASGKSATMGARLLRPNRKPVHPQLLPPKGQGGFSDPKRLWPWVMLPQRPVGEVSGSPPARIAPNPRKMPLYFVYIS